MIISLYVIFYREKKIYGRFLRMKPKCMVDETLYRLYKVCSEQHDFSASPSICVYLPQSY